MSVLAIEPPQKTAARVVGFLYIATNITAMVAFAIRNKTMTLRNPAQMAKSIDASETLFRFGIVTEIVTIAAVLALAAGLHIILRTVDRNLSLLALLWRIVENIVLVVAPLAEIAMLALARTDAPQVQTWMPALYRVYGAAFNTGFIFLGLGSALFSYLWWRSNYIPRALAAFGIFASLAIAIASLLIIVWPPIARLMSMTYMAPMGNYEFGLGGWLLIKGIGAR